MNGNTFSIDTRRRFIVVDANRTESPRANDAIDSVASKSRDAKQHFARSSIDVNRKKFRMRKCPGEFWIDVHREVRMLARQQLIDAESVVAK